MPQAESVFHPRSRARIRRRPRNRGDGRRPGHRHRDRSACRLPDGAPDVRALGVEAWREQARHGLCRLRRLRAQGCRGGGWMTGRRPWLVLAAVAVIWLIVRLQWLLALHWDEIEFFRA